MLGKVMELENKLKKYEAIEMDLGIPLEVLFKALKEGIWAKHLYTNGKKITYHKPCQLHFYRDVWVLWVSDEYDNEFIRVVKEYGNTWALTREELENAKD